MAHFQSTAETALEQGSKWSRATNCLCQLSLSYMLILMYVKTAISSSSNAP